MVIDKRKKAIKFAEVDGKCEYCGVDMILSFKMHEIKDAPDNMATVDHKYNRDHELRGQSHREKRRFIVCRKCNAEKSKTEPNKNEPRGAAKTVKRALPDEMWSDEKFRSKIQELVEREMELSRKMSVIEATFKKMEEEKRQLRESISKTNKYKKMLIDTRLELKKCNFVVDTPFKPLGSSLI